MAFINDRIGKQLELFSTILIDEEIFKIIHDAIFERVENYLPLINGKTLRPILKNLKVSSGVRN